MVQEYTWPATRPGASTEAGQSAVTCGSEVLYRLQHFNEIPANHALAVDFLTHHLAMCRYHPVRRIKEIADLDTLLPYRHSQHSTQNCAGQFAECLRQAAPVMLTEPDWLQDVCQAATNQDAHAYAVFRVYRKLTDARLQNVYTALLLEKGLSAPQMRHAFSSRNVGLLDGFCTFAAIQLSLAYAPDRFFLEILGFTLAYCRTPSVAEQMFPQYAEQTDYFRRRNQARRRQVTGIESVIADYLAQAPRQKETLWLRIQTGFRLYQLLMKICVQQLERQLLQHQSATWNMIKLLQRKAGAAIGHHRCIKLQGQALDDWFGSLSDAGSCQAFLDALSRSAYVDNAHPESSRLLNLFSFDGPMFGVFNQDDCQIVKDWLREQASTAKDSPTKTAMANTGAFGRFVESKTTEPRPRRYSNRQLFYYLLNANEYPQVLPVAAKRADRQLALIRVLSRLPFTRYTHEAFDHYLQSVYQQEMTAYQPLTGKPKISRAAYVWGFEQFAPTVLIDGVWLQHSSWLKTAYPEIADILTGIYADEVGNGRYEQSHPVVFGQLLAQLGIGVPPVSSKAFAYKRNFISSAFDLPVFMLTLARFPQRFLPELLGLNMAIELSGLGKVYLRMIDELDYWQIDSTIARLHVTIDNFADGHAAQAKTAIQLYLDAIRASQGERVMQQHWRRIVSGYAALRMVCWRFKLSVPAVYIYRKISHQLMRQPR